MRVRCFRRYTVKANKKIKKGLAGLLVLAQILLLWGCSADWDPTLPLINGGKDARAVKYLDENRMELDTAGGTDSLAGKDTGFDAYSLYLIGESHAIAYNLDAQLYLVKYFNRTQNIRYIFIETGYCDAQLANLYLETGDTLYIDKILSGLAGTFSYNQDSYDFYKGVYEYNLTLPEDEQIKFAGVDIQHQADTGCYYLYTLLPDTKAPSEIAEAIETFEPLKNNNKYPAVKLDTLLKSFADNEQAFRGYLGESFDNFKKAAESIEQGLKCYESKQFNTLREDYLIDNFKARYEEDGVEKGMGIFGSFHTALTYEGKDPEYTLAQYLNREWETGKGKIAVLTTAYINCFYRDSQSGKSKEASLEAGTALVKASEKASGNVMLYRLDREESPFVENGEAQKNQYILVIKDSPASEAYKPETPNLR